MLVNDVPQRFEVAFCGVGGLVVVDARGETKARKQQDADARCYF